MQPDRKSARRQAQNGFTLVETVAAFAIASVVIFATAALLHNLALSFDRGTNSVAAGEGLAVAAERLATDIASTSLVLQKSSAGIAAAFAGSPTRVVFIGLAGADAGQPSAGRQSGGQEVISLTVESAGDVTQIVRRRAAWPGPHTPFQEVALKDDVVLVEGTFDAAFKFAGPTPDGTMSWVDTWAGERTLPRLVKLTLRDRTSGVDLLGGAEFGIRADAPLPCAAADAGVECLSNSAGQQTSSKDSQQSQRTSP